MDQERDRSVRAEYTAKVILTAVFLGGFLLFSAWRFGRDGLLAMFQLSLVDVLLLGFATLRMGRMIAFDLVMEPFRAPFARTVPDETGAGDNVEPVGRGVRLVLGQLITCPICAGTWSAAILVYGLYAWPAPAQVLVTILGAVGIAEVLNSVMEHYCWSGVMYRAQAGEILKAARRATPPQE